VSLTPDYTTVLEQLEDEDDDNTVDDDDEFEEDKEVVSPRRQALQQQRSTTQAARNSRVPRASTRTPVATFANNDNYLDHVVSPLKTMVFIDGTWLYYAIHERPTERCAIKQALGANW